MCLNCRRKRLFAKQDISALLEELGVHTADLMPKGDFNVRVNLTGAGGSNPATFPPFLPIHIFDDTEYDCHNPEEWLELGVVGEVQKPVPGKALLPRGDTSEGSAKEHQWTEVGALGYDAQKQLYLVQVVGTGSLHHNVIPEGVANTKRGPAKKRVKMSTQQHWIPRIQLLFAAEDPVVFAERVAKAYAMRQETEALLRYNLYVDCMPMNGLAQLDSISLERMIHWARGIRTLKNNRRFVQ